MERYRTNFEKDDPSGQVGDVTFLGVDQYSAPENIQPGNVQAAVNVDFTTTNAQTRGGFVCLPELGAQAFGQKWNSTSFFTTAGYNGITFAKNQFVAVGSTNPSGAGNPTVMTSRDAISWSETTISASTDALFGAVYGNGTFVVGGNSLYYSTNLTSWTASVSTPSVPVSSIAYGNGVFVCVCNTFNSNNYFIIGRSTDAGVTWSFQSDIAGTYGGATDVIFANGKFVALTYLGNVLQSADGITWTFMGRTSSSSANVLAIEFGNNVFCAVGLSGIFTSTDLVTWTQTRASSLYLFSDVNFYNGRFVAIGTSISTGKVLSVTSIGGYAWLAFQTGFGSPTFYSSYQCISSGSDVVAVISSTPSTYKTLYSYDAARQNVYASALYSDPNVIGATWVMLVGGSSVGFYAFGEDSRSVSLGGYTVNEQSTIVQCNNLVYLFRGPDQQPLYWDGNWSGSFQLVPLTTPAPGFETIPYSNQATYYQNRLWVVNGKDTISASDVLDFNTYDQLANEFNISTGNSDYLVATFPFGQTTLLAFKHKSILALQAVEGALTDVIVTEVTRQVGLVGINAIVSVGPDLAYVSDKNINLITLTSTNNAVQHKTLPLSSKIREIMRRVNWEYAYKISLGYLNNRLYVSLPLDNSQFCNAVVVYNFITENWYGEWNFDSSINMCIQGWQVANYLGLQRMHAITEDGRIFVTDEGQNDISGATVAEISMSLTTRPYNANNLNHFQRRLFVDIATLRPSYSIASYTEGVNEESVLLENQTYSRSESWKFSDSAYDLTNANDDYNRAYRKDYSTGPASVQCGSGFLPEKAQQIRLPLISQRNGRLSWLQITNTQGFLELLSAGFEVRPGMRGSLVQV